MLLFIHILAFVQKYRMSRHFYQYEDHQNFWQLIENIRHLSSFSPANVALMKVFDQLVLKVEEAAAIDNSMESFYVRAHKNSLGLIYLKGEPKVLNNYLISKEVMAVLDAPVQRLLRNETITMELAIKLIQPPLKRLYVRSAHEHFIWYVQYQWLLRSNPGYEHLFESDVQNGINMSPTELLRERIVLLEESFERLFKLDYHTTPLGLVASWSLAQYIRYISRLYPQFQIKVGKIVMEYFSRLHEFIRDIALNMNYKMILPLPPNKRLNKRHGVSYGKLLFKPVPTFHTTRVFYHCVSVNSTSTPLCIESTLPVKNIIVFITENAFKDMQTLNYYISKITNEIS